MCLSFVVCCRGCSLSFVVVVDLYCCVMSMLLFVVVVRCFFAVCWLVVLFVVFVEKIVGRWCVWCVVFVICRCSLLMVVVLLRFDCGLMRLMVVVICCLLSVMFCQLFGGCRLLELVVDAVGCCLLCVVACRSLCVVRCLLCVGLSTVCCELMLIWIVV